LLYGDGVFEGIRFYNGRPFRLPEHIDRLVKSAKAIALDIPYGVEALAEAVAETVAAFAQPDGYLRFVVTRGVGPLGLDPAGCSRPTVFVIASQLSLTSSAVKERGARLIIAATRRLSADGLDPRIKSLNYLNSILAKLEANHAGAHEAVLLNRDGRVAECTAENLFVVRGKELVTPPVTDGALDGVTRRCVMELAAANGLAVREAPLAPYDLYTADECFLTGTGAELIPVREVDGRQVAQCPGAVFSALQRQYEQQVRKETLTNVESAIGADTCS
jgi:branched-chain amino acid aminotransferase